MAIEVIKIPAQGKEDRVYEIRGKRVMIDRDLAECFGMETKYLNRVVKRNLEMFASNDYMLQLSLEECSRCQIVTLNDGRGGNLKYLPNAFTEEGVKVLAQVLKRQVEVCFDPPADETETLPESWNKGTVVLYRGENGVNLDVQVMDDTVWLTQEQIARLFDVGQPAISKHLSNIFNEGELEKTSVHSILEYTATDGKTYSTQFYNLDAILSVGYRVNSRNATLFRKWASSVLKDYLIKGYSINQRLIYVEQRLDRKLLEHDKRLDAVEEKIDFFVKTNLPPVEGVVFDGQIFDAYDIACKIVRSARERIILFDNYMDETVLTMLDKRGEGVSAAIYTNRISRQLSLDITRHNEQYREIEVHEFKHSHDRFLCIDDTVYHIGASLKDLGKKWFAFSRMEIRTDKLLDHLREPYV